MKKFIIGIIALIVVVASIIFVAAKGSSATPSTQPSSAPSTQSAQNTPPATVSDANKKQSEAFFAENKTKSGIVTLPSGLQYKVLEVGNGNKPAKNSTVVLDFEGRKLNGQIFQSAKGLELPLNGYITGMREALQLMPTGSTWMIFLPPSLGYGQNGGGSVGPNEALIIKLHLVAVK